MRTLGTAKVLATACVALALVQPAFAAEESAWTFEATPYMLAAGMKGTVGVRGYTSDADVSFSDIMDTLDSGFMGILTAQNGRWSFGLEAAYMKLEDAGSRTITSPNGLVSANGTLDISSSMTIFQGSAGYRIVDDQTKVDLIGALRYTKLEAEMELKTQFTPGIVFPGARRSVDDSKSWTDAVVGVRVLHPVADDVTLMGYVDVGAGGSDLTYQVMVGANWAFAKGYTAKFGYRHLDWDYEKDGIVWDMKASGPYLGLGITF